MLLPLSNQPPTTFVGLVADRGEIGAGVRLRHADAKNRLGTGDGRHDAPHHIFRAGFQDLRPALPIRDSVGRDRGAGGQHRLQHHIPFKGRAPMTAIFPWARQAQKTGLAQFGRKRFVIAGPGSGPQTGKKNSQVFGQKGADLGSHIRRPGRQVGRFETEGMRVGLHFGLQ